MCAQVSENGGLVIPLSGLSASRRRIKKARINMTSFPLGADRKHESPLQRSIAPPAWLHLFLLPALVGLSITLTVFDDLIVVAISYDGSFIEEKNPWSLSEKVNSVSD